MALSESREEDLIEIVGEFNHLQIRTAIIIKEDGEEISPPVYHRKVLAPDADVSNESQLVQDVAAIFWTQEIKDAWAARNPVVGVTSDA